MDLEKKLELILKPPTEEVLVRQELKELFEYLKGKNIISNTYPDLSRFLGVNNVNWDILYDEPRKFRNCLVHNFRYIHTLAEELYFPDITEPRKFI